MSRPRPPPHLDVPQCQSQSCGSLTSVVPYEVAHKLRAAEGAPPGSTLFCLACGYGWEGTQAEVDQAVDAQMAWDAMKREMDKGRSPSWDPTGRQEEQ